VRKIMTVVLLASFACPAASGATVRYGPLQISGSLATQNLVRHPDVDRYYFIQQRNTLRLQFDLDVIKRGAGQLGFSLPGVKSANFYLLYRPAYDSVFDIMPGGRADVFPYAKGIRSNSLNAFTDSVRDSVRNGNGGLNALREVYLDLALSAIPLSFRIGRQMVVWGETDNFRMLDRVNPLDLTWHAQQESWDEIRIPLWMIKVLYKFGDMGPFRDSFLEGYWGLGDWVPGKQKFLPYPWSTPLEDPFINKATCTDPNNPFTCQHFGFTDGGVPFRRGDYDKNPIDNGQWGARFVFTTPQAVQIGLHYFYNRFSGDDGSLPTFIRAVDQLQPLGGDQIPTNNLIALGEGNLPAKIIYPYVHTVGVSANYSDDEYTEAVYRMETIYEFDLPFSDLHKAQQITNPDCVTTPPGPTCGPAPVVPSGLYGTSNSDMWNGMVAFDRPTWIRAINQRATIFFTGQFFWHYVVTDPLRFVGGLGPTDKVRRWESLITFAASSFFGAGSTDQVLLLIAVDPVNHYNMQAGWKNDYHITNNIILTVFQNYFFVPGFGGAVDEHWNIGGLSKKRDETGIRITQQF